MKEHDRDIRFARTQSSAFSEHANKTGHKLLWEEVKFIDRDNDWYTRKVKEAIHIRLNPNNINRDNEAEIPEAWMPTIKKHENQGCAASQRTPKDPFHNIMYCCCVKGRNRIFALPKTTNSFKRSSYF